MTVSRNRDFFPLSGFWEAEADRGNPVSPLLVQINQAGGALAIWFTRPPAGLTGVDTLSLLDERGDRHTNWNHGVARAFSVDRDGVDLATKAGLIPFTWFAAEARNGPADPARPASTDPFNPLDPWLADFGPGLVDGFRGSGFLQFNPGSKPRLYLTFSRRSGPELFLKAVERTVRWPRRLISQLPEPMRTQVLIDQTRPIPTAVRRRYESLVSVHWDGAEARAPVLEPLLTAWKNQLDGHQDETRRATRARIAYLLETGIAEPWRTRLLGQVALHGHTTRLALDQDGLDVRTYYEWLHEVLQDEAKSTSEVPATVDGQKMTSQRVQEAIRSLGVGGEATFLYRFTFHDVGRIQAVVGARLGRSVAMVEIAKFRLKFKLDGQGRRIYDELGQPVTEPPEPVDWSDPLRPGMYGVLGMIDAGLTLEKKLDKSPLSAKDVQRDPEIDLKTMTEDEVRKATQPAASKVGNIDLGSVDFRSELDLRSPTEFGGAFFVVASTASKFKVGNLAYGTLLDSSLWQVHVPNHGWMSAIVDKGASGGLFKPPSSWGQLMNPNWWKNWVPQSAEASVFRVGMCFGMLGTLDQLRAQRNTARPTDPEYAYESQYLTGRASATFLVGSADLDQVQPGTDLTGRMRFEQELAEIRAVLDAPGGAPVVLAFTSPEDTVENNEDLAKDRAEAAKTALRDALGRFMNRPQALVGSNGEMPARTNGEITMKGIRVTGGDLVDPEEKYGSVEAFRRSSFAWQERHWPYWRRVDLFVEGNLVTRWLAAPPKDSPP